MKREKLFYDLHQTIKEVRKNGYSRSLNTDFDWVKTLTGEISQMEDETLDIVLNMYSRLTSYTLDNINFIISQANLLKGIFYLNGEFVEENLPLLYEPYAECLVYSPIITLHCLHNNIPSDEVWDCVLRCSCSNRAFKPTIENLILGNPVTNHDIIDSLQLLYELHGISEKFSKSLDKKAGPLHKMQMDIYEGTESPFKDDERKKYIKFLKENIYDEDTINRVIEYINTHEFDEITTLKKIRNLDVNYSDEFKSSCDTGILLYPDFKWLYKEAPKIAKRLSELHSTKKIELNEFTNLVKRFLKLTSSERELIETLL